MLADANGYLYTVAVSGGVPEQLALPSMGAGAPYSQPVWSPGGERIALTEFTATGTTVSTIWTVEPDGTEPVPVTDRKTFNHHPVWSVDGGRLFFISDCAGCLDIW